jgi:hypothetical protein
VPDARRPLAGLAGGAAALAVVAAVALRPRAEIGAPRAPPSCASALRAEHARLGDLPPAWPRARRLPAHLRALEECDELAIDYRLTVDIDGARRLDRIVSPSGAVDAAARHRAVGRGSPGRHRVALDFAPPPGGLRRRLLWRTAGRRLRRAAGTALRQEIDLQAGRAVLVTLADDGTLRIAR